MQQLVAATTAEHANQGVIDFNKASIGAAEKEAFLNIVKKLAVTALGFAAIGNVF